jgi:hypothetical protein
MTGTRDARIPLDPAGLADMANRFASVALAATGRGPLTHEEVLAQMDLPICRWCREPVIRGVPCGCDQAQRELAAIRAGTER